MEERRWKEEGREEGRNEMRFWVSKTVVRCEKEMWERDPLRRWNRVEGL